MSLIDEIYVFYGSEVGKCDFKAFACSISVESTDFNRKSYSKLAVKISGFATNFNDFSLKNIDF